MLQQGHMIVECRHLQLPRRRQCAGHRQPRLTRWTRLLAYNCILHDDDGDDDDNAWRRPWLWQRPARPAINDASHSIVGHSFQWERLCYECWLLGCVVVPYLAQQYGNCVVLLNNVRCGRVRVCAFAADTKSASRVVVDPTRKWKCQIDVCQFSTSIEFRASFTIEKLKYFRARTESLPSHNSRPLCGWFEQITNACH